MKKILVSLVSDQTTPNVEFILEMRHRADAFLFLSTDSMERKGNRQWILDAVQLDADKLEPPLMVDPHSFEDIEKKLSEVISDEDEFIVNLTGGTKVMSLAVFEFFKEMNAEIYYLTGSGQMIKLHPGRKKTSSKLTANITLKQYLTAYGFALDEGKSTQTFEQAKNMLRFFLEQPGLEAYEDAFRFFRLHRGTKKPVSYADQPLVAQLLEEVGFQASEDRLLDRHACRFFSGEWLEEYLYGFIKAHFDLSDENIALGSDIRKGDTKNELDVLVSTNNNIYMFECKTSIYPEAGKNKSIIGETIYKSDSLRNGMGLFAQTVIVTLSDLEDKKLEDHKKRADASRVQLIGRKDFVDNNLFNRLQSILRLSAGNR